MPHDNSSSLQARITKFGPDVPDTLVKIPFVFVFTVKFNLPEQLERLRFES